MAYLSCSVRLNFNEPLKGENIQEQYWQGWLHSTLQLLPHILVGRWYRTFQMCFLLFHIGFLDQHQVRMRITTVRPAVPLGFVSVYILAPKHAVCSAAESRFYLLPDFRWDETIYTHQKLFTASANPNTSREVQIQILKTALWRSKVSLHQYLR